MIRRGCCSIVQQVIEWAAHRITTAILNTVIADIAVRNSSVRSPPFFEQKFDFVQLDVFFYFLRVLYNGVHIVSPTPNYTTKWIDRIEKRIGKIA